jgi:hypothetical protein
MYKLKVNQILLKVQYNIIVRIITTKIKKKTRKIAKTENRFSGQNYKNTNSQTKKNKTIRNQITAKNIPQTTQKKN